MKFNLPKMKNDGQTWRELPFSVQLSKQLFVTHFTSWVFHNASFFVRAQWFKKGGRKRYSILPFPLHQLPWWFLL